MDIDQCLEMLSKEPHAEVDVAEVALLLARDEFPHLDVVGCLSEIDAMGQEARAYVRGNLEVRARGLCRYLFHEMGFHGNIKDYYDPANSYFNQVLERRTGIPITLSALTMAVGKRAGLTVEGVGLPGHFIVKAVQPGQEVLIDPFHGGRLLTAEDCVNLVRQVTGMPFDPSPPNLSALPVSWMALRMLANLKGIYLGREDYTRAVRVLERMAQLQPEEAVLYRELGMAWLQLGRPGKAVDPLQRYLSKAGPEADDYENISKVARDAVRQVARWN